MPGNKVGQEFGAIRSSLPLEKLEPFLEKNVQGYQGPLEVQQFKFGQVSPLPNISMWGGWMVADNSQTQHTYSKPHKSLMSSVEHLPVHSSHQRHIGLTANT